MMKYILAVMSISICVIAMFAGVANAVTLTFYYDGLDLDTGTILHDSNVVIVLHGTQGSVPQQFFKPADYAPEFNPAVDLYFEYESTTGITLAFPATQIGLTGMNLDKASTPFANVDAAMIAGLVYGTLQPLALTTNPGPTIILETVNGWHFKLGNFVQSGFAVQCDFELIYTPLCGNLGGQTLTVAGNPYLVTCPIQVDAGQELIIESGVELIDFDLYPFTVNGQLTWYP